MTKPSVGRGHQAKHDSAAPDSPGVHPSHLSPSRQVGLGSCPPATGSEARPQNHTLRTRLSQGPRRGRSPTQPPGAKGTQYQPSSNPGLPCRPATVVKPVRPQGAGGTPPSWATQASRSRLRWMGVSKREGSPGPGAFPSDIMMLRVTHCWPLREGLGGGPGE